jgi:concanavalin A-like lectin/glucanase superfamily protein
LITSLGLSSAAPTCSSGHPPTERGQQRQGSTLKTYQDGKLANTTTGVQLGDLSSGRNLQFGRSDGQSTDWYFDGQLDDVLLFNYALTSAQIRTLHNQNAAVRFAPLTGSP